MKKAPLWTWRLAIGTLAVLLMPLSLWYMIAAVSVLDFQAPVSSLLPIPFVPELLSAALGLILATWGIVALWWLIFQNERLSLRGMGVPWRIGLVGGTVIDLYWLVRFSASDGQNDEFVLIPALVFVLVFEVVLLIRMSFNSALTASRSDAPQLPEDSGAIAGHSE